MALKTSLSQTISALDIFLDTSLQDLKSSDFYIKIYESVYLENGKILRTSREFQDEDTWYGKGPSREPYELALVRWYNIKKLESEVYSYSHLYYTEEYNAIPIGSINQKVYIVPRFDKKNCFLLNKE
ncbi:hypothetical protein C1645_820305 [Glomus cerebriforme]|uniref:Uncharacterized protein n=1 Tax=Glomus cerebriforme TaxID=658196 RepID=A0A397TCM4_9GLOM|nr:hypothetical protein C1645_820305 [Glomus cerebriforme]